jgi:hypothetical protein
MTLNKSIKALNDEWQLGKIIQHAIVSPWKICSSWGKDPQVSYWRGVTMSERLWSLTSNHLPLTIVISNPSRDWILLCEEAIQLAYVTSVVLLISLMPEVMHEGVLLHLTSKLENCHMCHLYCVGLTEPKNQPTCSSKLEAYLNHSKVCFFELTSGMWGNMTIMLLENVLTPEILHVQHLYNTAWKYMLHYTLEILLENICLTH